MLRKIIRIDTDKCDGCGLCVSACHEGAIGLIDGKACLLRDDYCDGLGACLPICPLEAITFEEREAAEFDEAAVKARMEMKLPQTLPCGCSGSLSGAIQRITLGEEQTNCDKTAETHLNQWPVQIKLVPPKAPYFDHARLLVAADCAAYAYGNFHSDFMRGKVTIIGCPKLDDCDYSEKLTVILQMNHIEAVTVARMEVPCCSGIESAVSASLQNCGKHIPHQSVMISADGKILKNDSTSAKP